MKLFFLDNIINFYKKHRALCCVLFILTAGLISASWFRGNNLFSGTDTYFPIERSISMKNVLFAWDDRSFGFIMSAVAFFFPYGIFLIFSEYLNISLSVTQKIWFYYIFVGSGLSMFFLVLFITKITQKTSNYLVALFAALFYMFNPYVGAMATSYTYLWVTYSFLPLKLGLYMKGVMEKKNLKYIIYFLLIWILTSASQYTNPKYLILDLLPIFLFFLYYLFFIAENRLEKIKAFKFSFIFFILLIFLSSYWLLPIFNFISETFSDSQKVYDIINLPRYGAFSLNSAIGLTKAMRLIGLWALYGGYSGIPYFGWINMYKSSNLIFLGYLIPLVASLSLFLKTKIKLYHFLFILNLISLFGMMGAVGDFGKLNLLFVKKIPFYLDLFSYPYHIFGIYFVLSLAVLLSVGVHTLYSCFKLEGVKKIIFVGLLALLFIGVYGGPVWTGEIMFPRPPDTFKFLPSYLYKIPVDYYEMSNYLNTNKLDSKIFSLPYSKTGGAVYLWDYLGYAGIDITSRLFGNVIYGANSNALLISNSIIKGKLFKIDFLMSQLNSRYVLFHHDNHPNLFDKASSYSDNTEALLKNILNDSGAEQQFGKLDILKIKDSSFLPHFYTPKSIIVSFSDVDKLFNIVSSLSHQIRSVVYFDQQNLNLLSNLLDKNSFFISLFDSKNKNQKSNRFVLSKNQADNIYTLNKTIEADPFVDIQYFLKTEKIIIASQPIKKISINGEKIIEEPASLFEIPAKAGDFLKIGKNYFNIQGGYSKTLKLSELNASDIEIYRAKLIKQIELIGGSFEKGLWQKTPGDCSSSMAGKADFNMRLSQDSTEGFYSLEIGSNNHSACSSNTFSVELKKDKIYVYSFDYKSMKGDRLNYYYNLIGNDKTYPFSEEIAVNGDHAWNHYETIIKPEEDISKINLFFYAPSDGEEVINRYDNIKLSEVKINLADTYKINQSNIADNVIIKDNIRLKEGENMIEYIGDMEADGTLPKNFYNYYLTFDAGEDIQTPILEFKKINPTKYRVRVHGAKGDFSLVFSESFHSGWKAYLTKSQIPNPKSQINFNPQISNYKILDGNVGDQASKEELADYINKGWVMDLGNLKEKEIEHKKWENDKKNLDYIEKYNINFVSKNFQDTIQNNNLPNGQIWDTWLPASYKVEGGKLSSLFQLNKNAIELPEENHLIANGYANSWIVETEKICGSQPAPAFGRPSQKGNSLCIRNPDGTYDFELVVEFWPQRLFYLGLAISGLTLFGCIIYLAYDYKKRKKGAYQV